MTHTAPHANKIPTTREFHGDTVEDNYEWLRDKSDQKVIDYLNAENDYAESVLAPTEPIQKAIFGEIKGRTKETDASVPTRHGSWWHFARTYEGKQYASYHRSPVTDSHNRPDPDKKIEGEQLLFDSNELAEGHEFFRTQGYKVSPNDELLVTAIDNLGDERYTLRISRIESGEVIEESVTGAGYGLGWSADSRYVYYGRVDEAWRAFEVWRHEVGTDPSADTRLFHEPDERFNCWSWVSRDGQWLIIHSGSTTTTEVHLLDTTNVDAEPVLVSARRQGLDYTVEPAGDEMLIVHNLNSVDFEVSRAPIGPAEPETWEPVLRTGEGERVLSTSAFEEFAVVYMRSAGLTQLRVMERTDDGWGSASVVPGEDLATVELGENPSYDAESIDFTLESLLTPLTAMEYRPKTGELSTLKVSEVPGYDRSRYEIRREWAEAEDGTKIPLTIAYLRTTQPDGTNPGMLYGYGSYEIPSDPYFSVPLLSVLDRGVVYAIAHIRGGGEMGRAWYENGKELSKKNTFTDFIAAADFLIDSRWVAPDRLAAEGGSAGGLLMGAVTNMAPDRFRVVHARVPFVDALTTILDPSLPLTVGEWEEWGDPYHDPEVYQYMRSYTPYENIAEAEYPAILATTSLNDTRVFYTEPAKWVARLRDTVTNGEDRPILLLTEMVAGHGGRSGRYNAWEQRAKQLAFIMDQIDAREVVA